MSEAEYVICKWKNRLWPAKVLPKRSRSQRRTELKNELTYLRVEIFSLNKQANVRFIDTQPLKEETLKDIAAKLERQPKHCKGTEELVYRRALREALIILNKCTEPGGFRSPGRRAGKSGQKTPPSLAAYHEHLSFPGGPPEKEGNSKVTEMPSLPEVMLSIAQNPSVLTASPKCQPLVSELQEMSDDRHHASSEEQETLADLYTDGSVLCPSKEAKKLLRVGERPSHLILASPDTYVGLTPSGQNVGCEPGQGKASPVAQGSPNRTHSLLGNRGASKGAEKDPDGGQTSGNPPGVFQEELSTISPTCCKSQDNRHPADHVASQPSKKFKMTSKMAQCSEASCPRRHHEMLSLSKGPPESSVPKATTEENQNASPEMRLTRPQDFEESPLALPQRLSPRGETHHCPVVKDEEEEEDELPRILWYEEAPPPLEPGMLVWCKLRRFPYWPAVVKSVKRKAKKANVVLIEKDATEKKAKGFSIPLRNLKHFDCKEKQILINEAKEKYRDEISWSINFIIDYRIKVAGEAFVGSFLDYFASDSMSKDLFHPLYQLNPSKMEETEECQSALGAAGERESSSDASPSRPAKKLLPDRSRAARDKANERIVDFIVKARRADGHLWAVLRQEKESRWLREFLAARPYYTCTETYLEDEGQQEQVLGYLRESFEEASSKMPLPRHAGGGIKFILDVMFPEAVIWAISAVDNLDYKTAEAKYLRGPLVSQRERKEFEEEILEKKRELEQRAGFLSPL